MKLFQFAKDGGPDSTVTGFFLMEIKRLFSVALLRFDNGSRDAYHDHAFSCLSWVLRGKLIEHHLNGDVSVHTRSLRPIITLRDTFHRVVSEGTTWVFTLRGPWQSKWHEFIPDTQEHITLTNGRKRVEVK